MKKPIVIGLGAAGNKIVFDAVKSGALNEEDTMIINSTSKDFPKDYKGKTLIISPQNVGCGKETNVAKAYMVNTIKNGELDTDYLNKYSTIILVTSCSGGTGAGSTPVLAQYLAKVMVKNVHIFAIVSSSGDDIRGLYNTVEFFKEVKDNIICHTIDNTAFLSLANGNQTRAEELANQEFIRRYKVLSGDLLIAGSQNIDDTDMIKLSNTYGYTTVEYKELNNPIGDSSDYDKIVKRMIYESKSIKSDNPAPTRIGVILNLSEQSKEALGDIYSVIKEAYGTPYELYNHIQYDGKKEYIAFIVAGMNLPTSELSKIYDKYVEESKSLDRNNSTDNFFDTLQNFDILEQDKKFDMIKPVKKGITTDDFLSSL